MKTIIKLIKEQITKEESYIKEHNEIIEMLTPLEDKQFNFRTFSDKNLKGFKFHSKFGMFYITGKYEHLIGYRESNGVSVESFKKHDSCHGSASQERISKLKNIDAKELQKISNKMSKAFNELRYLFDDMESKNLDSFNNPIYYNMLRNIYDESEEGTRRDGFKMSDLYYLRKKRN